MKPSKNEVRFASVFDAVADTPEEAAQLKLKARLMLDLRLHVEQHGWSAAEAAKRCQVTRPCLDELMAGKIDRFNLDALICIATKLGLTVRLMVEPTRDNLDAPLAR